MKKIIFIFCLIALLNFILTICSTSTVKSPAQIETLETHQAVVLTKPKQAKYTITNYKLTQHGDIWKFVLVDKNLTEQELSAIAKEIHNKYPTTCFKLFATLDTLELMYKYDSTNSYTTKQIAFPESSYNRDNRGIINPMWNSDKQDRVWTYTTNTYSPTLLE